MLSQSERGRKSRGRKEMERRGRQREGGRGCGRKRAERKGDGETERGKERVMGGCRKEGREGGREKERINSSGALVPHYPGRALSPWQCGRKRIAQA